jgi:phage-related holin
MFLHKKIVKKMKIVVNNWVQNISEWMPQHWEQIKVPLYTLFAFLQVDIDIVHIIMWLMIIDTISGIAKAVIVDKIKFTLEKFYTGIMSKFVLLLIPITLALMALGIGYDFTWAVEATLRLIILSEGISFFTNIVSIRERKVYENRDYLSIILNWVREKLISIFDSTINDKNKENDKRGRK